MLAEPIIDLYPIVVDLDDETLDHGNISDKPNQTTNDPLYDAVASEASWMASERSFHRDNNDIETEVDTTEKQLTDVAPSTPQRRRKIGWRLSRSNSPLSPSSRYHNRCGDDERGSNHQKQNSIDINSFVDDCESTASGGVFGSFRSLLQLGSYRQNNNKDKSRGTWSIDNNARKPDPEETPLDSGHSPGRIGRKGNRPRRFIDEYVLTQQIVQCRIATLWECVHRPTGRRYCVKAIDKRRFPSARDRAMAVREVTLQRWIHQWSPLSCLPTIHDVFADDEASEQTQHQHDDSKSSASCCSCSTMSSEDSIHNQNNNYWYVVQDFEAGGGNLGLYLLVRENSIHTITTNNNNSNNDLQALADTSLAAPNTMQEPEVRSLAQSLLLALNELHCRSICHNDLCPENILVPLLTTNNNRHRRSQSIDELNGCCKPQNYRYSRHQRSRSNDDLLPDDCWKALKLCDLGRAFFVDYGSDANATSDTASGSDTNPQHSSIYYTSPEVISGKPSSLASDMWSVGVILYRCLAGELPFREQSEDILAAGALFSSSATKSSPSTTVQWSLRQQLKREICKADCNFGRRKTDLRWSRVSRGAKQFLTALLNPNPSVRMTCEEALHHPWLLNGVTPLSSPTMSSHKSSLTIMPVLPSSTSTNHYHHHPNYSTMMTTISSSMEDLGDSYNCHQEESADDKPNYSQDTDGIPPTDSSNPTKPRFFVHKLLGHM